MGTEPMEGLGSGSQFLGSPDGMGAMGLGTGGGGGFGASVSPLGEVFYGARCGYTGKVTQPWWGGGGGGDGTSKSTRPRCPQS